MSCSRPPAQRRRKPAAAHLSVKHQFEQQHPLLCPPLQQDQSAAAAGSPDAPAPRPLRGPGSSRLSLLPSRVGLVAAMFQQQQRMAQQQI